MPELLAPPTLETIDLDGNRTPWALGSSQISEAFALTLVQQTFNFYETWRAQNCDQRWRLNEYLYYGAVPLRTWEGSTVPRSNLPVAMSQNQVEGAHARLSSALLNSEEILNVTPGHGVSTKDARAIRDRLNYLIDNDLDDFGWNGRIVLRECLRDFLIYGNNFAIVEWDDERHQAVFQRLDPRDVYVDPSCPGPRIDSARNVQIRKLMSVDEVDAMRSIEGMNIPSRSILNWLAQNREVVVGDQSKTVQEGARGYRYNPLADDFLPDPSKRYIEVLIHQQKGGQREIWTLNRRWVALNIPGPYGCMRVVSAPCQPVPNRFYAQSYVDLVDPLQQASTALLNRYMDETALALNPPKAAKRGMVRTPSSLRWRPGAVMETDEPQKDMVVFQPQGVMQNVWGMLQYLETQAEMRVGSNSLSASGMPKPGNANRTRGGMQMQMQAPAERLGAIAANFEEYFFVPLLYKLLRVEKLHAEGPVYAKGTNTASKAMGLMNEMENAR